MLAGTSVLSKSILCFDSVECLTSAEVSFILCMPWLKSASLIAWKNTNTTKLQL
jgi:hypothetical protein